MKKPRVQHHATTHFVSAPPAIEASSYASGVTAMVPPGSILAYIVPVSGTLPPSFPVSPPAMSEDEKWRRCIEALPEQKPESI